MCKDTIESIYTQHFVITGSTGAGPDPLVRNTFISVDFVPDEVNFKTYTATLDNVGGEQCYVITSSLVNGNQVGVAMNFLESTSTYKLKRTINGNYTFWLKPNVAETIDDTIRIVIKMEFIRYK